MGESFAFLLFWPLKIIWLDKVGGDLSVDANDDSVSFDRNMLREPFIVFDGRFIHDVGKTVNSDRAARVICVETRPQALNKPAPKQTTKTN